MRGEGFLEQLSDSTIETLLSAGSRRQLPKGSYLYFENDPAVSVYVVEDGAVRVERHSPDGRSKLLDLIMPGELFGEYGVFEGRLRSTAAVTVGRATVVVIGAERFLELFESCPDLARGTARWLSLRGRGLADRFLQAAHATASVRLCARLLQLMSVDGASEHGPVIVVMPISQADLAEWAGLSREAAVKALRELRNDGVVETSRGRILVLRPDQLRERAETILR